ncbi:hypothetical protein [Nocardioides sp. NPDC006273]|uniref:hypothetical protein n=1 Tax=Nocardioides sp. NPDC006273 TaxID=3155598 RepID=UPI0033A9EA36
MLFTFGSSIRRWHAEDQPLAKRQRQLETDEDEANDALARQQVLLEAAEIDLAGALAAADTAHHDLEAARSAIDTARREMSGSQAELRVPDEAWSSSEHRERLAPWLDVTWNKARTQLSCPLSRCTRPSSAAPVNRSANC